MTTKEQLISAWKQGSLITDARVVEAFRKVPREKFILPRYAEHAYEDAPLPIPAGQTISQPTTVLLMSQALDVRQGMSVLEVGAGSGYQGAILAELVGASGQVHSVETVPELVNFAQQNLRAAGYSKRVTVSYGDGSQGFAARAPYERIIVTAAAPAVPPPLLTQLKDGGILLLPLDSNPLGQTMVRIRKHGDVLEREELGQFTFVPLTGKFGKGYDSL